MASLEQSKYMYTWNKWTNSSLIDQIKLIVIICTLQLSLACITVHVEEPRAIKCESIGKINPEFRLQREPEFHTNSKLRPKHYQKIIAGFIPAQPVFNTGIPFCFRYICDRDITPWAIGDWAYWPSEPDFMQQHFLPSILPEETQARIWQTYDTLARKLINFGFDYQFLDIEVFVCDDGEVRLMEANPRMSTVFIPQYLCVMRADPLETLLDSLQGKRHLQRIEFTGKHSSTVFLPTLISGRVSDIMDVERAKSMENLVLDVEDDQMVEVASHTSTGTYLGHAWLFGDSREDLLRKHQELYAILFKTNPLPSEQIDQAVPSD